jgi:hypothetical protein
MALYAHALIELPDGTKYDRGDEVPEDAFSAEDLEYLRDGGSLSDEPYDPAADIVPPPEYVEIDGVRYKKESDDA